VVEAAETVRDIASDNLDAGPPFLSCTVDVVAKGVYGYTFTIHGNDGRHAAFYVDVTFEGANGGEIQQMQVLGLLPDPVDVDDDLCAEGYCGQGQPPYCMYHDTYFLEPFACGDVMYLIENPNYYHIEAGTGGGSQYENAGLAYIVATGDVHFYGRIFRGPYEVLVDDIELAPPDPLVGDANHDGSVDGADYTMWADNYQQMGAWRHGDFNGDCVVDGADYTLWADHYEGGLGGMGRQAALATQSAITRTEPAPAEVALAAMSLGQVGRGAGIVKAAAGIGAQPSPAWGGRTRVVRRRFSLEAGIDLLAGPDLAVLARPV
jgi:hypothetical protein